MYDFTGKEVLVGDVVILLQTPVRCEHKFITGVVDSITAKTIHVHVAEEDYIWSQGIDKKIYKRYPKQLIVLKRGDQ